MIVKPDEMQADGAVSRARMMPQLFVGSRQNRKDPVDEIVYPIKNCQDRADSSWVKSRILAQRSLHIVP
jgi:hypothetical protein